MDEKDVEIERLRAQLAAATVLISEMVAAESLVGRMRSYLYHQDIKRNDGG